MRLRILAARWLPELVLACSLLFTAVVGGGLLVLDQRAEQARFGQEITQAHEAVRQRIGTHIAVLRATAGLFDASEVDRRQFEAFARRLNLAEDYPGIQGVGWSIRLDGAAGGPLPVWPAAGPERHTIVYLYPMDRRNQAAIGYNMYSESRRRAAMALAAESGLPAVTAPVQLVQEIEARKQTGFLIYVPVYRGGGVPASPVERRQSLLGFAYGAFRAGDLFSSIFGDDPTSGQFRMSVYDGPRTPANLLYRSEVRTRAHPHLTSVRELSVAGRTWVMVYESSAAFERNSGLRIISLVVALGLFISAVLYLTARELVRRRLIAEAAVEATGHEIEARRRIEQNQELLIQELNHRVKNTLATVQSVAAQTLRFAGDPAQFKAAFTSRLVALSQAHNLLALGQWQGSNLEDLIAVQLDPFGPGRATLSGHPVTLAPAQAVAMSLAIHELATNSSKYGALSVPTGGVEISWRRSAADGELQLTWKERGGPPVSPPTRRGFGSRLLESGLSREFGGGARLRFEPDGVRCELHVRLAPVG